MQYVLWLVKICKDLLLHFNCIKISTYDTSIQDTPIETDFMGDFAEVEGTYIQQHLIAENILLASRVHIRNYEGNFMCTWYNFIHKTV